MTLKHKLLSIIKS